ncbi:maltose ABC transporter substrate-binding protein [Microbacterium deminutum]|uniref:Extracellular solute-binding protein n=1 Tax=Microbacterium deminutum TaxID=344164 RepID=A0ABP5CQQ9_9MICO
MRKKLGISALAFASVALLLAGCSGGGGGSATPSETKINGKGAELVVWVDANREPAVKAAAVDFEKATGAKVTLVKKNFGDIRNDFINQVPTGQGPDITIGAHDWLGALVEAGVVDTIDLGDKASEFNPKAIQAMTYNGQLYALPYSLEAVALVQNVDLVGDTAPTTWDQMIQMGKASGAERPVVINTGGQAGDAYTMYGNQTSFGAPVFMQDSSGGYTNEVGMGGAAGDAFATWLGSQGKTGTGYISTTVDYDTNNQLFDTGKAAFTIQGPWAIAAFKDVKNLKVSPIPSAGGQKAGPFVGVQGFYVSSQSKNALLAQEFLVNYLATADAQKALYEADPRIPAWTALAQSVSSDPIIAGFIASAEQGEPMPNIPQMGSVWDLWNAAQVQIINGADPTTTWNKMITDVTAATAK